MKKFLILSFVSIAVLFCTNTAFAAMQCVQAYDGAPCPAGCYMSGTVCYGCPKGTYSSSSGGVGLSSCISCIGNTYSNTLASTSCKTCTGTVSSDHTSCSSSSSSSNTYSFTLVYTDAIGVYQSSPNQTAGGTSQAAALASQASSIQSSMGASYVTCTANSSAKTITCACKTDRYWTKARCETKGTCVQDTTSNPCAYKLTAISCPAGQFNNNGTCTGCQAGTYSAGGTATSCTKCPAGTYSGNGASSCTPCAAGTYSAAGAYSCTPCPSGYTSAAGAEMCTGNYTYKYTDAIGVFSSSDATKSHLVELSYIASQMQSSMGASNVTCTANNSTSTITCACVANRFWSKERCESKGICSSLSSSCAYKLTAISCPAGQFNNNGTCTGCQAGTYSAGGTATSCTKCPAGTYSGNGASSCTPCAAGTYSAAGAYSCTPCPSGQTSAEGASSCTKKQNTVSSCPDDATLSSDKCCCVY